MKILKKNLKLFMGILIGTFLVSGITAFAVTKLYASDVSINTKNIDTLQEGATLQDALDDLYDLTSGKYFKNTDAEKMLAEITTLKEKVSTLENSSIDKVYPVGSIYISTSLKTTSEVANALGGTWESYGDGKVLRGTTGTSGQTGGASTVSLATANLPSHNHSISSLSGSAASSGAHTHTVTASGSVSSTFTGTAVTSGSTGSGYSIGYTYSNRNTNTTGAHTHIPTVNGSTADVGVWFAAGSSRSSVNWGNNSPAKNYTMSTTSNGDHYHTYPDYYANSISGVQAHTHTVTASGKVSSTFTGSSATTSSSGSHTHSITTNASTTGSTGSGTAFSVLDPYITVYMYKRVK